MKLFNLKLSSFSQNLYNSNKKNWYATKCFESFLPFKTLNSQMHVECGVSWMIVPTFYFIHFQITFQVTNNNHLSIRYCPSIFCRNHWNNDSNAISINILKPEFRWPEFVHRKSCSESLEKLAGILTVTRKNTHSEPIVEL